MEAAYEFIYVIETLSLKDFYDWIKCVSKKPFFETLWNFIFDELKKKSNLAVADDPETAKRIFSARGEWLYGIAIGMILIVLGINPIKGPLKQSQLSKWTQVISVK